MNAALERAVRDGSVQVVFVLGEPGIGKSRLGEEFASRVEGRASAIFAYLDYCGLISFRLVVHAENVHDSTSRRKHCIPFQPTAEPAVQPLRIAAQALAARPRIGFEEIGIHRRGHHERA